MTELDVDVRTLVRAVGTFAFLSACGFFAWRVFDGRWAELGPAMGRMSYWMAASMVLTVIGLLVTSRLWSSILASYGYSLPWARGASAFFVGQVGKYLPGSVWSIGIQARLVRAMGAPAHSVIGTGLVFLALHVASAMCLGGIALALSDANPVPRAVAVGIAAVGAAAFHPRVLSRLSQLLSGGRGHARTSWRASCQYGFAMVITWCTYTGALVVLIRSPSWSQTVLLVAAVTLSYAVGVLVVVAPAGLGAREALFVALMSPSLGLAEATALALVARLVHTAADFVLAILGSRSLHNAH